ncbi:MAG: PEGA domain-containing protein [Deltaproteobacteria bacterium]|nr:PEGA domain-containing protein [Deltaproteobacteria bacterium]
MRALALVLLSVLAAAPAFAEPGITRILVIAPRAEAPAQEQLLHDAVMARLRASTVLALVPEDRFRDLAEAPPPADDDLRQALDGALKRVKDAYRRLAVGEATRILQEVENARLNVLACPENIEFAAQISLWLGVVHAANREPARAAERFASALFADPKRTIDASYFPPQTVALFEKVRAEVGAAPKGGLSIKVDPDGAQVFLDGREAGAAPLTLNAAEGDHFVCVRRLGSRDWVARLRVVAGKVESQSIFLQHAGSQELASQLVTLLARDRSVDLDNPSHVQAVGAAVGADAVAAVGPGPSLSFRLVREPRAAQVLTPDDPAAAHAVLAGDLVGKLEAAFRTLPESSPDLEAPPQRFSRFSLELTGGGGYAGTQVRGAAIGGLLGAHLRLLPALSLGLRAGATRQFGELALLNETPPSAALAAATLATVEESLALEVALEARLTLLENSSGRLFFRAGFGLQYVWATTPAPTPMEAVIIELSNPSPFSFVLLCPQAGLGATYALAPRWDLVLGLGYRLGVAVAVPEVVAVLRPRSAPNQAHPTRLAPNSLRHMVALDLGIAFRFD